MNKRKILLFLLLFLILAAIPLTIFLARQQQDIRQRAAGSTTLSFAPATTQTAPLQKITNDTFSLDMMVNPGTNSVSVVRFEILYDSPTLELDANPVSVNTTAFPATLEGPIFSGGKIAGTVSIGSDYTKAIRTTTRVLTLRFKASRTTGTTPTQVRAATNTQVLSVGSGDQAAENVLSSTQPAYIAIVAPTPTPTACVVPSQTGLGKITGNTADKCEKITWNWTPAANATLYVITLDGVEKYRGPGTPCSFDSSKLCYTISGVTPGNHNDCLQSGNSCGLSTPSCGVSNVGACPVATATPTPTRTPTPTATPVPTNTPIPTNTPVPQATRFNLTAFMHGIGNSGDNANPTAHSLSNKSPIHQQRTTTVEVLNSTGDVVLTKSGLVNYSGTNGNFTGSIDMGTTLASGVYNIKIKSHQYLRRQVAGIQTITAGQTTALPAITLVTGDINGDNALNILDYNIIIGCYSDFAPAVSCTDTLKIDSDLTDDGKVNQFDYNLFLRDLSVQNGD